MKKNNPGCNCCTPTFSCSDCASVTSFSVSGLNFASCTSGCNGLNGTYVFRTIGIQSGCVWFQAWSGDNCGSTSSPYYYIGQNCGGAFSSLWQISFALVGSLVRVTVQLTLEYTIDSPLGRPHKAALYNIVFYDDFATCADSVGATLTARSTTISKLAVCTGSLTDWDPGDLCGLFGVTVTIG